jgi:hypothetical protein
MPIAPIDHDQLFKQLIQTFFLEFLELFAPALLETIQPETLQFLPQEYFTELLEGDRKAIDLLAQVQLKPNSKVKPASQMILVHIENQSYSEALIDRRIFFYFAQLYREYQIPIYPLVLFSFDEPLRAEPHQHRVILPDLDVLTFNFRTIQLNRLNWRKFLKQQNPIAAALMAKMKIKPQDRPKVKIECLRLLATLQLDPARTYLISGFIDTYLRLDQQEEQKFQAAIAKIKLPQEKARIMQITTSWMEQGLKQGLEEGLELGKKQATQHLVQSFIERRLGSLPIEITDHLQKLSIEQLETLLNAAPNFTAITELTTWLNSNTSTIS